ncbi:MAG: efflux RND transporter periplasmic adaptor subunit [Hyphomonas sp.]
MLKPSLKKYPLWTWIVAGVVAAMLAALVWKAIWGGEKSPEFQTADVSRGDIEVTISAAGKIVAKDSVAVGAQVSGQLQELLVEAGDQVEKGDLLARIDATIATTSVEANRAQLRELQASRKQQQATLQLSKSNADRAEMLFKSEAIARADYEAAQAEYTIATGRLEAIDAQIARQASSLTADLATLEFTNIYAPISGTVVSIEAVEGQTLNANQTAPTILTLADLSVMTVETDVSEADVLRIEPAQTAWFTTLGDAARRWETNVRQVLPTPEVLNDVVLYKALLDIANPEGRLKPQMTAQVFFVTGSAKDAVLVPVTALQSGPARRPRGEGGERDRGAREIADRPARTERSGGLMQAEASGPPEAAQGDGRRAAFREAREANPEAEMASVRILDAKGVAHPQPVLVGLKTRTEAEIVFGLEPGQTVVTGEVSATGASPAAQQQRGPRSGGPPGGMRRPG